MRGEVPFRDEGRQPLDQSVERDKSRGEAPFRGERGGSPWTQTSSGKNWWALQGSNLRHSACKADALPTELSARFEDEGFFVSEDGEFTDSGGQCQLIGAWE